MADNLIEWSDEDCLSIISDIIDEPNAPHIITCAILGSYLRHVSIIVAQRNVGNKKPRVMNYEACTLLAQEICEVVERCMELYLEKCNGRAVADPSILGFVGATNEAVVDAVRRMASSN